MPVVRLVENGKIVIPWYGVDAEGSLPTVSYYIENVSSISKLVFKVYVKGLEKCVYGVCSRVDNVNPADDSISWIEFKVVVNDKYVVSKNIGDILRVGDLIELDATSDILPYITDGYNAIKLICIFHFMANIFTHAGYHVYVDFDMSYDVKEEVATTPEQQPKISKVGYTVTPSEAIGTITGTLLTIFQPILPYAIFFFVFYLLLKIIF